MQTSPQHPILTLRPARTTCAVVYAFGVDMWAGWERPRAVSPGCRPAGRSR